MESLEPLLGVGLVTAWTAGLLGNAHCAGMCGPLALWLSQGSSSRWRWQVGRLLGYTSVGAVAGKAGQAFWSFLPSGFEALPAWLLGFALLLAAFDRALPPFGPGGVALRRLLAWGGRKAAASTWGSFVGGAITPFLPCGLSWSLWFMAASVGTASAGALLALSFASASAPGLWLFVHLGTTKLLPLRISRSLRRAALLLGAFLLFWRAASFQPQRPELCHPRPTPAAKLLR